MNHLELARDWQLALAYALSLPSREEFGVIYTDSGLDFWAFNGVIKFVADQKFDYDSVWQQLKKLHSYSWKIEKSSAPWYLDKTLIETGLAKFLVDFPVFVREIKEESFEAPDTLVEIVKNKSQFDKWEECIAEAFNFLPDLKEAHATLFWGAVEERKITCFMAVGDDGEVKATGAMSLFNSAAYISNGTFKDKASGKLMEEAMMQAAIKAKACAAVALCEPDKTDYMKELGYEQVTSYQYYKTVKGAPTTAVAEDGSEQIITLPL